MTKTISQDYIRAFLTDRDNTNDNNIKKGQQQQSKKQIKYRQWHYESKYLEADNQVHILEEANTIQKSVIQLQKL